MRTDTAYSDQLGCGIPEDRIVLTNCDSDASIASANPGANLQIPSTVRIEGPLLVTSGRRERRIASGWSRPRLSLPVSRRFRYGSFLRYYDTVAGEEPGVGKVFGFFWCGTFEILIHRKMTMDDTAAARYGRVFDDMLRNRP